MSEKKSQVFEEVAKIVAVHNTAISSGERYAVNLMEIHFKFNDTMTRKEFEHWRDKNFPNYEPYLNPDTFKK